MSNATNSCDQEDSRRWNANIHTGQGAVVQGDDSAGRDKITHNYYNGERPLSQGELDAVEKERRLKAIDYVKRRTREFQLENLDADARTFDWLWKPHSAVGTQAGPGFVEWLEDALSREIFFISGKPASGKSTLMHHVSQSKRTLRHLASAAGEDWKVVHFFFDFRAGKGIPNNLDGLARSLMYQLCESLGNPTCATPKYTLQTLLERSAKLKRDLLNSLGSSTSNLLVLVDGLDEYQGDRRSLAQFLDDMAKSPGLAERKVCVASRPEMNQYFATKQGFIMQDWNSTGMEAYVHSVLTNMSAGVFSNADLQDFTRVIIEGAQGVFLWTHLVLQETVAVIEKGESKTELFDTLLKLPTKLSEVYDRIFARLTLDERIEAGLIFAMLPHVSQSLYLSGPEMIMRPPSYVLGMIILCKQMMAHILKAKKHPEIAVSFAEARPFLRRVEYLTGGLITITSSERLIYSSDGNSIAFHDVETTFSMGHETVFAYLKTRSWFVPLELSFLTYRIWLQGELQIQLQTSASSAFCQSVIEATLLRFYVSARKSWERYNREATEKVFIILLTSAWCSFLYIGFSWTRLVVLSARNDEHCRDYFADLFYGRKHHPLCALDPVLLHLSWLYLALHSVILILQWPPLLRKIGLWDLGRSISRYRTFCNWSSACRLQAAGIVLVLARLWRKPRSVSILDLELTLVCQIHVIARYFGLESKGKWLYRLLPFLILLTSARSFLFRNECFWLLVILFTLATI